MTLPLVSLEHLRATLIRIDGEGAETTLGAAKLDIMRHHHVDSGFPGIPLHVAMGPQKEHRLSMTVSARPHLLRFSSAQYARGSTSADG